MGEYWDLFNQDGEKVGELLRDSQMPPGCYHKVVSVWVRDRSGRYLMSKRCAWKRYPNLWECTGGCVQRGESELEAAVREMREEVGIILAPQDGRVIHFERRDEIHDFYTVWYFELDADRPALQLQPEEVADAKWMDMDEIDRLWEEEQMHPLLAYYRELTAKSVL